MFNIHSNLYLILFGISVALTYLAVRRSYVSAPAGVITGSITNSLFTFLYAISKGNGLIQALVTSLIVSILFAIAAGVISASFRSRSRQVVGSRSFRQVEVASH
jgi:hypothetical protein